MSALLERPAHTPAGLVKAIEIHSGERRAQPIARGRAPSRSRLIAFYAVTVITGVALSALGLSSAMWPWFAPTQPFLGMRVEAHRWHGAEFAALLTVMLGGSLLALLWRPARHPLLAQYLLACGALIAALLEMFAGPLALLGGIPFALLAALYPDRAALFDIHLRERWSRASSVLTVAASVMLIQPTYIALSYQILYPNSEHAEHYHWVAAAGLALALSLGGLLAATRRPGWRILAALTGVAYTYLGLAAIAAPTHAGSWGVIGGVLAVVAGSLYVTLAMIPGHNLPWFAGSGND